jgi:tetrahydromethanopterin S-methyltransferase subunit G
MEAAVAEKEEVGMTEWNDGRLDDLSKKVDDFGTRMDDGFARVEKKMGEEVSRVEKEVGEDVARVEKKVDAGFARVDAELGKLDTKLEKLDTKFDKKLDALQRTLLQTVCGFAIGMLTFAGALIGLIATKV